MSTAMSQDFLFALLRSSIVMIVLAVGILSVFKVFQVRSLVLHRVAWLIVLIQGCIFTRIALEIPWYEVPPIVQQAALSKNSESKNSDSADVENALTNFDTDNNQNENAPITRSSQDVPVFEANADNLAAVQPVQNYREPASSKTIFSLWKIGLAVWVIGLAIIVAVHLFGYISLIFSLRKCSVAPVPWRDQWNSILRAANVKRTIPMMIHPALGPMVCRSPSGYVVVVPQDLWEELSYSQRAAVLRHELAHYLRGDIWKSFLVRLVALPQWFNPVAWMAVRRFDECSEWACDSYLAQADPRGATDFANALVNIAQYSRPVGVGFLGAGGSLLAERVRRLCSKHRIRESIVKKSTIALMLIGVAAVGLADIKLVPVVTGQEQDESPVVEEESSSSSSFESNEQRISEFAENIYVDEGDDLIARFKKQVVSDVGQTALLERATRIETNLRQQAQARALPIYLDQYFDQQDNRLILKSDQSDYREQVLSRTAESTADVVKVQQALNDLADRLEGDGEAEKMIERWVGQPLSAWILYATEIRKRLRPSVATIGEMYEQVFVSGKNGELLVRPGVREQMAAQLELFKRREQALVQIERELKSWSDEIAEHDSLHRTVKEVFSHPFFAAICTYDSINENTPSIDRGIQSLFEYFEYTFEDHSDGLRLNEQGQQRFEQLAESFGTRVAVAERLEGPMREFADRIPDDYDELHSEIKRALKTKLPLARLSRESEFMNTTPSDFVKSQLENRLQVDDSGKLIVPDESQEEIIQFARNQLRTGRQLRLRFRSLDEQIARIQDSELRDALHSNGGKLLIMSAVQRQAAQLQIDAIGEWIKAHFAETDDGWVLNEEARNEIEEYLNQVDSIRSELGNDDFQ